jgi:hypothetical protein
MITRGQLVAVDLDHSHLSAVSATVGKDRVTVGGWMTAERPSTVDSKDARAVGRWIRSELSKAGLSLGRVVASVARGDVVLKRLSLPGGAAMDEAELAGMVRLQMVRQLTMPVEGTAIDYVPLPSESAEADGAALVLAGAMPADRLEWLRQAAKSAKVKVRRVGLRAAGIAALLAPDSQRRAGPTLGVALGGATVEFVVVEDGRLVFARAADIDRPESGNLDDYAHRVAVEAKRTWMSYRVSRESAEVETISVLDSGEAGRLVAERCAEALEMPAEAIGVPAMGGSLHLPDGMPEDVRARLAPLIGLLAEPVTGRPALDFENPRKAPDPSAATRQRVLLSAFGVIVIGGAGYLVAKMQLSNMGRDVSEARSMANDLGQDYMAYLADEARLQHLEQWLSLRVDWLAHMRWLNEQLPPPSETLLGDLSLSQRTAQVEFTPKDGGLTGGRWSGRQVMVMSFGGRVPERSRADDLRGRIVDSRLYDVRTPGPDTEDLFRFELESSHANPFLVEGAIQDDGPAPAGAGASGTPGEGSGAGSEPEGGSS